MQGIGKGIHKGKYYKVLARQQKYKHALKVIEITQKQYDRLKVSFTDGQNELDNYFKKRPEELLLDAIFGKPGS